MPMLYPFLEYLWVSDEISSLLSMHARELKISI